MVCFLRASVGVAVGVFVLATTGAAVEGYTPVSTGSCGASVL
jgi:hypothetical protein